MHATDLPIPAPCDVPWESMEGTGCRRLCSQCDEHVHDLSALTAREARRVAREGVCVQYRQTRTGEVVFRRSRGARLLAIAGALLATPAFAGQKAAEAAEPTSDTASSSVFEVLGALLWGSPETPIIPEVEVTVTPTEPSAEPVMIEEELMMRGKIAFPSHAPTTTTPSTTTPSTTPSAAPR